MEVRTILSPRYLNCDFSGRLGVNLCISLPSTKQRIKGGLIYSILWFTCMLTSARVIYWVIVGGCRKNSKRKAGYGEIICVMVFRIRGRLDGLLWVEDSEFSYDEGKIEKIT